MNIRFCIVVTIDIIARFCIQVTLIYNKGTI